MVYQGASLASNMSSQRKNKEPSPIELQQTGVPADYFDPNQSHSPTNVEAQIPPRPFPAPCSYLSQKLFWIVLGSLFALGCMIGGAFLGIKLGTDKALAE